MEAKPEIAAEIGPGVGRRRGLRRAVRAIAAVLLVGILGYVGISVLAAHLLTRANNRDPGSRAVDFCADARDWSTRTADGLTLRGWYCGSTGTAVSGRDRRLIVLVHGKGASREAVREIGRDLHREGYDVLLFDLRGHGTSDPSRLTMGARERGDVRAVLDWALAEGYSDDRIGWVGHSMGASTLLMEGAENPRIHALVLDSPFGDLPELLDRQLTEHSHLPRWFNPGILLAARYAFGVRTDNLVPRRSARIWGDRPLLLIHGEADSVVPVEQAGEISEAIGPTCRSIILPGVEHVGAYGHEPSRYIAALGRFFDQTLGEKAGN